MKIGTKLGGGFLLMALLVGIAGGSGIYGISQLAKALTFISGPAWDAADGAMEGNIGIEKQMIALERMMADGSIKNKEESFSSHRRMLDEGERMTKEAFGRMRASGLIPEDRLKALDEKLSAFVAACEALLESNGDRERYLNYSRIADVLLLEVTRLEEVGDVEVEKHAEGMKALIYGEYKTLGIVIVLAIFITFLAGYFTRRFIVNPINQAVDYTKQVAEGNLKEELQISAKDELGRLAKSLQVMVGGLRKADADKVRMVQISTMVEQAGINMLLCDSDFKLVFLNAASRKALKALEHLLPCRVDEIVGQSIDIFQKDSRKIRRVLSDPANLPHSAEFTIGDLTLEFTAEAVMSEESEYIGVSVTWANITDQKNAQKAVERMIALAAKGRLCERINAESFEGFYKTFALGMNRMLDAIQAPLNEAKTVLNSLAEGDLRCEMTGDYQGTFGNIKENLNGMIGKLSQTLSAVRTATETVTMGVTEISSGNDDFAQRTSEQASALQETSASMEQIASTVKQNADNAQQASHLAIAAHGIAEKGGQVTAQTIAAMVEVNKSSKKIVDIISVIDEIAFQTNLLALNAAVEAARAGEHGRGFAVVAAEVRNLAQRSGLAAKEIKSLIHESVHQVTESSALVNESGQTLKEIVQSVKRVTEVMTEISTASQEQSIGISEVNKAIIEMDETTQQNAALVEEAASSSHGINAQGEKLLRQVSFFTFDQVADEIEKNTQRAQKGNHPKHAQLAKHAQAGAKTAPVVSPETLHPLPSIIDWPENGSGRDKAYKPGHKPVMDDFDEF